MIAQRSSQLFRIALLCYAVLFGQTAHAAQPARILVAPGSLPSQVKLLVAPPRPRQQLVQRVARPIPPRPIAHSTRFTFPLPDATRLRAVITSEQTQQTFHAQHAIYFAPQLRPYSLRI